MELSGLGFSVDVLDGGGAPFPNFVFFCEVSMKLGLVNELLLAVHVWALLGQLWLGVLLGYVSVHRLQGRVLFTASVGALLVFDVYAVDCSVVFSDETFRWYIVATTTTSKVGMRSFVMDREQQA